MSAITIYHTPGERTLTEVGCAALAPYLRPYTLRLLPQPPHSLPTASASILSAYRQTLQPLRASEMRNLHLPAAKIVDRWGCCASPKRRKCVEF
ncbi:hypothetical protein [uncultured Duncaniella sp.]|uniref:hypothetical protein n=1 Tax=uncultured Duncaniella sp. TaxID=2768039 RepID=UPI0026477A3C|nr:hypothetical protein [uncultured Duncaniella sp.]